MTTFIERSKIENLTADSSVTGEQTLREVLDESPASLVEVEDPTLHPLDLETFRIRHERFEASDGPVLHGMGALLDVLTNLTEPARAAFVCGTRTNYQFLFDADLTTTLAMVAIDRPKGYVDPWKQLMDAQPEAIAAGPVAPRLQPKTANPISRLLRTRWPHFGIRRS